MTAELGTLATMPLLYARSTSKTLGVSGEFIEKLRDNSPRIVGALKLGFDVSFMLTGNPLLMTYAAFAIAGRLIAIAWGTKENQEEVAEQHIGQTHAKNTLEKIRNPKEYPVEASSALSVIAESFGVAYGVSKFMKHEAGFTPLVLGLVAVWSYANILLGKEKNTQDESKEQQNQDSLTFKKSNSKPVGWYGKLRQTMKENPVLTSSVVNVALCVAGVIGGIIEGHGTAYVAAFVIGIVANSVQGLLVKKREFNIEGAKKTALGEVPPLDSLIPGSFRDRILQGRENNTIGLLPT